MENRLGRALACALLGSWQLGCTGTISEDEPPSPQQVAVPGAGSIRDGGDAEGSRAIAAPPTTPATSSGGGREGTAGDTSELPDLPELPDPPDLPELPPIEFCDAPTKVLMASCGNGSCHSNRNATIGDFAVDAQRAYDFVDRVSSRHAECGRIIDSRDYGQSLLLTKVKGDFEAPRCGERMPVGSFTITNEQIDCLASWLQQFQL